MRTTPDTHHNTPEPAAPAILAAVDADHSPLRLATGSAAVNTTCAPDWPTWTRRSRQHRRFQR
jgi:hypothetical protein